MPKPPRDHVTAFRALYERHRDDVWRYLRRRSDHHAAEDLTAEVFVVAWRRRADLPGDPLPWLYGVARGVLANHRRSVARATALAERVGRHGHDAAGDHADLVNLRADVAALLARLPGRDREVLLLVAWEGLTSAQAARVLGIRETAARVRLHRARKRLRAAMDGPDGPALDLNALEATR
jgi:RNA polymerase sigma-70 factor (ECF subfamily)